jgi:hypothetical protein
MGPPLLAFPGLESLWLAARSKEKNRKGRVCPWMRQPFHLAVSYKILPVFFPAFQKALGGWLLRGGCLGGRKLVLLDTRASCLELLGQALG